MMRTFVLWLFAGSVAGHGISDPNVVCPSSGQDVTELPPFQSYHIHVLFWPDAKATWSDAGPKGRDGALRLRSGFIDHFNLTDQPNCTEDIWHRGYQGDLCMMTIDETPGFGHSGPFPVMNWAVWVPLERFYDTVPWIMQNHQHYDVLVHPNTGCMLEEHSDWALWVGEKWQLLLPEPKSPRLSENWELLLPDPSHTLGAEMAEKCSSHAVQEHGSWGSPECGQIDAPCDEMKWVKNSMKFEDGSCADHGFPVFQTHGTDVYIPNPTGGFDVELDIWTAAAALV